MISRSPCKVCKLNLPNEGTAPDPCFGGLLPGVKAACCGHGDGEGFILFDNGLRITFHADSVSNWPTLKVVGEKVPIYEFNPPRIGTYEKKDEYLHVTYDEE